MLKELLMYGVLLTIGMMVSFALSLSITRKIENKTTPLFNNGLRIFIGTITFNLIAIINQSWILIYSVPLKYQLFLFLSIICNAGSISTISTIMPIISFLLEYFILNVDLSFWILISAIISGIGVSIIFYAEKIKFSKYETNQSESSIVLKNKGIRELTIGFTAGIISAIAWAFGNFFIAIGLEKVNETLNYAGSITHTAFALRYNFAFICFLIYLLIRSKYKKSNASTQQTEFIQKSKQTWASAILSAVLFTSIGTFFYGEATQIKGPTFVSIFNTTLPLFQFPINWVINKEKITPLGALGSLITISGVILLLVTT